MCHAIKSVDPPGKEESDRANAPDKWERKDFLDEQLENLEPGHIGDLKLAQVDFAGAHHRRKHLGAEEAERLEVVEVPLDQPGNNGAVYVLERGRRMLIIELEQVRRNALSKLRPPLPVGYNGRIDEEQDHEEELRGVQERSVNGELRQVDSLLDDDCDDLLQIIVVKHVVDLLTAAGR